MTAFWGFCETSDMYAKNRVSAIDLGGAVFSCENIWTLDDEKRIGPLAINRARTATYEMLEAISLFQVAAARMQYLAERQSVIARNIANADTPNYVARDLKPFSFDQVLSRQGGGGGPAPPLAMTQTSAAHLTGSGSAGYEAGAATPAGDGEKPDRNRVSLEDEMVKSADNTNAFALVSAAYAKSVAIMKVGIDK